MAKPRERTVRGVQRRPGKRGTSYRVRFELPPDPVTGERVQGAETFATLEAAEAFRKELDERPATEVAAAAALTVGGYLDRWLAEVADRLAAKTVGNYRGVIDGHLKPAIGDLRLRDLAPLDLVAYQRAALAGGVAPSSLTIHRAVLTSALSQAVVWRLIDRSPMAGVRSPKADTPTRPMVVWSHQEAQDALSAVEGDDACVLRLLLCCGLRIGEALALKWADVRYDPAELSVRRTVTRAPGEAARVRDGTKRGSGRVVVLDPGTVAALRAQFKQVAAWRSAAGDAWRDEGLVLPRPERGGVRSRESVAATLDALAGRLGLPRLTPHRLRHSHATHLLAAGVHPKVVQERLGHATIAETLNTYTHVSPDLQRQALGAVLAGLFSGCVTEGVTKESGASPVIAVVEPTSGGGIG